MTQIKKWTADALEAFAVKLEKLDEQDAYILIGINLPASYPWMQLEKGDDEANDAEARYAAGVDLVQIATRKVSFDEGDHRSRCAIARRG